MKRNGMTRYTKDKSGADIRVHYLFIHSSLFVMHAIHLSEQTTLHQHRRAKSGAANRGPTPQTQGQGRDPGTGHQIRTKTGQSRPPRWRM